MPNKDNNEFEEPSQTLPGRENGAEIHYSLSDEYRIVVKAHLDPCWSEWFEGWEMAHLENGEFLLSRTRVDQSALHGVLNKILDLNLTLVSVTRIPVNTKNA